MTALTTLLAFHRRVSGIHEKPPVRMAGRRSRRQYVCPPRGYGELS